MKKYQKPEIKIELLVADKDIAANDIALLSGDNNDGPEVSVPANPNWWDQLAN